jgi:hypothetical protein
VAIGSPALPFAVRCVHQLVQQYQPEFGRRLLLGLVLFASAYPIGAPLAVIDANAGNIMPIPIAAVFLAALRAFKLRLQHPECRAMKQFVPNILKHLFSPA